MAEITTTEFTERMMCRVLDSARAKDKRVSVVLPSVYAIVAVTDEIDEDRPCLICGLTVHDEARP